MGRTIKAPDGKMWRITSPDGRKIDFNKVVMNDDLTCNLFIENEIMAISATLPNKYLTPEFWEIVQSES